jgi:hypothetical protein
MDEEQVGAVLTFAPHVTEEAVLAALGALGVEVSSMVVASYNPNHTGPVWYCP